MVYLWKTTHLHDPLTFLAGFACPGGAQTRLRRCLGDEFGQSVQSNRLAKTMIGSHCPGYQFDSGFVAAFGGPKNVQNEAPELFRDSFWFTCAKQRICTTLPRFWQVLQVQEVVVTSLGAPFWVLADEIPGEPVPGHAWELPRGVRVKTPTPREGLGGRGEGTFLGGRGGTIKTHTPGLPPKGGRRIYIYIYIS